MTAQTYRALLVANSTFPEDPHNLPDLEGPRNDPALLHDALCNRDVGLFPLDNVRLVTERTMAEVLSEAEDFLASATRRDTLLVYYSGHGLLDESGELFLCTRDTRSNKLWSTAVKASDVRGMMDRSAAGTTVVLLDCCHSGRFKGGDIPASLSGRGRFVVTSSRSAELANDAHVRNHASLFTHHVAEGIVNGAEDHDGDGVITLSELYDYVLAALAAEGRGQVPQKRFEGDGDVALARRYREIDEHPLPGLVDPAASAPVLDLSDMAISLGEVGSDEELPPERVAVINRGGGTLDWVAESSDDWVQPVAEGGAVVLHLRPRPGPNRANVYVRDASGALKTVRVSVRVREPSPRATGVRTRLPGEATDQIEPSRSRSGSGPDAPPAVQGRQKAAGVVASDADTSPGPVPGPAGSKDRAGEAGRGIGAGLTSRRVALVGAGLIAAIIVAIAVAILRDGNPSTGSPVEISVDGTELWTDTDIDLRAGDQVQVTATGTVYHNEVTSTGPDGDSESTSEGPYGDTNHAGLIGRITDAGDPFLIGSETTFTADQDGRLYLGINDFGVENNSGAFDTSVRVTHS
jgi:Caspase domain